MPESFDSMLSELAEAAASATPLPDLGAVRRRARQRTVRRRMTASALALVLLVGAGGTVAAISFKHKPASVSVPMAAPSMQPSMATAEARPAPPSPAPSTPSGTAEPFLKVPLIGLWQRAGAITGYMIIYPSDGSLGANAVIGITEAGDWPLCYGVIHPIAKSGAYPITGVKCGGNLSPDMTLVVGSSGVDVRLVIQPSNSTPQQTIDYRADQSDLSSMSGMATATTVKELVGTWIDNAAKRTLTVEPNGSVTWVGLSHGQMLNGGGTVNSKGVVDGGLRVIVPCGGSAPEECGVFQFILDPVYGRLTVIGSYGPETFTQVAPNPFGGPTNIAPSVSPTATP